MDNIWCSIECDAWLSDFGYQDYLYLYRKMNLEDSKLSEKTYTMLCEAFDNQMNEDMSDCKNLANDEQEILVKNNQEA